MYVCNYVYEFLSMGQIAALKMNKKMKYSFYVGTRMQTLTKLVQIKLF